MATNSIVLPIDIRKNRQALSKVFGRYFPVVHNSGALSTVGLAKHMADHGSIVTEEVLRLVLGQLSRCIPELVGQGIPVVLDGLGTFYATAESVPGGAESVQQASEMGAANLVKGIHLRFKPTDVDLRALTSRAYKRECSLQLDNVIELTNVTEQVDGQEKVTRRLQKLTPIADWLYQDQHGDDGGGSDDDEPRP